MAIEWMTYALEQDIQTSAKFVLVALANRANQDGECWPSQKDLAKQTSMTDRSVRNALTKLEELGYITREHRTRKDGTWSSDRYTIHRKIVPAENTSVGKKRHEPAERDSYQYIPNGISETSLEPSVNAREELETEFQRFWEDWLPYEVAKGSKADAKKQYEKARKDVSHETIISQCREYLEHCHSTGCKTKQVFRWIRDRNKNNWEYEAPPPRKTHDNGCKPSYSDTVMDAAELAKQKLRVRDSGWSGGQDGNATTNGAAISYSRGTQTPCKQGADYLPPPTPCDA